ncbi:hypothetical protein QOT17_020822 [Balamuthia mandrillaris]
MGGISWSLVTLLFCCGLPSGDAGNVLGPWWSRTAPRTSHIEGAIVNINNRMYSFGGFNFSSFQATSSLYIYDPSSDTWSDGKEGPLAVSHCQGATDGERYLWIAGGFVGNSPGVATNQRSSTVVLDSSSGPDLPRARASSATVFDPVGRRLHLMGGLLVDRLTDLDEHLVLDASEPSSWGTFIAIRREWTILSQPIPTKRNHFQFSNKRTQAVYLRDSLYLIGGQQGHDEELKDLAVLERYDLESESWHEVESMPAARSHMEATLLVVNDRIVVPGGRQNSQKQKHTDTVFEYEPYCGRSTCWSSLRPLPYVMDSATGVFFPNISVTRDGKTLTGDFIFLSSGRTRRKIRPESVVPDSWMTRVKFREDAAVPTKLRP